MGFHRLLLSRAVWVIGGLLACFLPAAAATREIAGAFGLTVSVSTNGVYSVTVPSPQWIFEGEVGAAVSNLNSVNSSDAVGPYSEISFDFQTDAPRHAAIRAYFQTQAVLFSLTTPSGAANTMAFPAFATFPQGLHHVNFSGQFAYPTFFSQTEDSPWFYFDGAANSFVISPAANFMVASLYWGSKGELSSGVSNRIAAFPAGFTHQTLLVLDRGVNRTFDTWGNTLTTLRNKTRPANDADVSLNRLGYWTDNGATYYYSMEAPLSYAGTLAAVKADFDRQGIDLGYLQLDSWFYPKGASADWRDFPDGIYQYFAAVPLFQPTLGAFQQTVGVPLITHARWIDVNSPYRQQYQMSGNVSTDPLYWGDTSRYLQNSGVVTYEQDWLSDKAQTDFNLTAPDAFLDNMAAAMAQQNLTMQYCMATTRHFLQGSKYSNLTTIRASEDRFSHTRWRNFLYASRLASALGIWPFTDVFVSTETDNLILATLSAGPVGVGDRVGTMNTANLLRAVRADGVIVKPDVPLVPIDNSYLSDSQIVDAPLVSSTYTDFGGLRAYYLFAFPQVANTQATFHLADFGVTTPVYLYNYSDGSGHVVNPNDLVSQSISSGYLYQVAAPIGPSGIAILGDTGQFVTLGKKRIAGLSDEGTVRLTVAFARGETTRTIEGYSPDPPAAVAGTGFIHALTYDAASQRFSVQVTAGRDGTASIEIARGNTSLRPGAPVAHPPVGRGGVSR